MKEELKILHEETVTLAKEDTSKGIALLENLSKVSKHKIYLELNYSSLFEYCTDCLELSESQAYLFKSLVHKSEEVPELKTYIQEKKIHITNARRILPILNQDNQEEWLEKASNLSQRELEKEIVKAQPEASRQFSLILKLETEEKLKRVQDLLSKKLNKSLSLAETLDVLASDYLKKHDPIQKASRNLVARRKEEALPENAQRFMESLPRTTTPAKVLHLIHERDQSQCTHRSLAGKRCPNRRFIEIHHVRPVSHGGAHSVENLVTLCGAHHRAKH